MSDSINTINVGGVSKEIEDSVARAGSESANSRLDTIDSDLSHLTARVDAISHLPSGSTTADAELIDIRVGYNDETYVNAGTAVREQVSEVNEKAVDARRAAEDNKVELVDIRTGVNGEVYDTAGNAVRTQLRNVRSAVEDNKVELVDIRTGIDGEIYDMAGNAVRTQIKNVRDGLDDVRDELVDVRTGVNGEVYDTAGNSVRTQLRKLRMASNNDKNMVYDVAAIKYGENLVNMDHCIEGFIDNDGSISTAGSYSSYKTTSFIPVTAGLEYSCASFNASKEITSSRRGMAFYDDSFTFIAGSHINSTDTVITQQAPTGAKYIRCSFERQKKGVLIQGNDITEYVEHVIGVKPNDNTLVAPNIAQAIKHDISEVASIEYGSNLMDINDCVAGFVTSDGSVSDEGAYSNYKTSSFIPITVGLTYSFAAFHKNNVISTYRKAIAYFDEFFNYISDTHINSTDSVLTEIAPVGAKYIRCSFDTTQKGMLIQGDSITNYDDYISVISLNKATLTPPKVSKEIEDAVSEIGTFTTGVNLFNPDDTVNGFIVAGGTIDTAGAYSSYKTSDYIPVTADLPYSIAAFSQEEVIESGVRKAIAFYDEDHVFIDGTYRNLTDLIITETAPITAAFFRCSIQADRKCMAVQGSTMRAYVDYCVYGKLNEQFGLTTRMKNEVLGMAGSNGEELFSVKFASDRITLISQFGNKELIRSVWEGTTRNKLFNFLDTYIDSTNIKDCSDDITPLRVGINDSESWTIGSNHGWPCFSVPIGSLTSEDLGSTWTDGVKSYILAKIDSTKAYFIFPATLSNHRYQFSTTIPITNLTHVTGGTHTSQINVSGAASEQLYPSINNHSISYYIDGKLKVDDESICKHFVVKEEYTIIDYVELGNYLTNHIGTAINNSIPGCIKVSQVYDFTSTACFITTSLEALRDIEYSNCGFIQAAPIYVSGNNRRVFYVNNMGGNSIIKSSELYDATNNTSQITLSNTNAINADVAVNRFVELITDSNGNKLYGFVQGYIPDRSKAADSFRKSLSRQGEFRSSTLKNYPCALLNESVNAGDYRSYCCYRNYLTPSKFTNHSILRTNEATYVIIDAHSSMVNANLELPLELIGKPIEVVESYHFTLKSDVVNGRGVVFDIESGYGCGILKIVN
jgi:hypothetical protein